MRSVSSSIIIIIIIIIIASSGGFYNWNFSSKMHNVTHDNRYDQTEEKATNSVGNIMLN